MLSLGLGSLLTCNPSLVLVACGNTPLLAWNAPHYREDIHLIQKSSERRGSSSPLPHLSVVHLANMAHTPVLTVTKSSAHPMDLRFMFADHTAGRGPTPAICAIKPSGMPWVWASTGQSIVKRDRSIANSAARHSKDLQHCLLTCWSTLTQDPIPASTAAKDSTRNQTWRSIRTSIQVSNHHKQTQSRHTTFKLHIPVFAARMLFPARILTDDVVSNRKAMNNAQNTSTNLYPWLMDKVWYVYPDKNSFLILIIKNYHIISGFFSWIPQTKAYNFLESFRLVIYNQNLHFGINSARNRTYTFENSRLNSYMKFSKKLKEHFNFWVRMLGCWHFLLLVLWSLGKYRDEWLVMTIIWFALNTMTTTCVIKTIQMKLIIDDVDWLHTIAISDY